MRLSYVLALILLAMLPISKLAIAHEGGKSTIILIRHAEKAKGSDDPALSKDGEKRAGLLPVVFSEFKPNAFYTTDTRRTRQTLAPWAKAAGQEVQVYDAASQDQLAKQLKAAQGQTIVVVGHSNTIPQLVNLLTGSTTYTDLPDDVYGRAYIVRFDHGHAHVEQKEY